MKDPRIVITAQGEAEKELLKLHKSINIWRVKKGENKPLSMLEWAKQAHKALVDK